MIQPQVQAAVCILADAQGRFLWQLRDNIPTIEYPHHWGLFGGHVKPGEDPQASIRRELLEELELVPQGLQSLGLQRQLHFEIHTYYGQIGLDPADLSLHEGAEMGLFSREACLQGELPSRLFGQYLPICPPLMPVFLDFCRHFPTIP